MELVDGAVPIEQLEACLEQVRRDPPHPGSILRDLCLGESISGKEAARILSVDFGELECVLEGHAGITPELALHLEAAGWSTAGLWLDLQTDYDLAQARRRQAA